MLDIKKQVPLAPYTTFKIGAAAEFFAVIKTKEDLLEAINWAGENKKEIWILGGGSNVLISKKVKGLVLKNEIKGLDVLSRHQNEVLVEAKSGEPWTKFVNFTIDRSLYGLENLFLIYGTVGAAPVQNIGAYGVELKDVFHSLKAIDLKTGHERIFSLKDCRFGYRDSVFKNRLRGKYFIYSLVVKLSRRPAWKLDYGSIRVELEKRGVSRPKLKDVVSVIQEIRNSKLPNPGLLPNAGSFFKNVELPKKEFLNLAKKYPGLPSFPAGRSKVKIPTAWLIEQAGYKGKRIGPVGVHDKQPLVLVAYGPAKAKQVISLMNKVKQAVKKKFGLDLQAEVNII